MCNSNSVKISTVRGVSVKRKIKRTHSIGDPNSFRRALFSKRGAIRDSLTYVRSNTPENILEACIAPCLDIPAYRAAFAFSPFPKTYESIKPRRPLMHRDAPFEFAWTSTVLRHFQHQLNSFIALRDSFENCLIAGKYEHSKIHLDKIEEDFGVSFWLIGARIRYLQLSLGVTTQKEHLNDILGSSGINIFVAITAFYNSFSVEENVSRQELTRELGEIFGANLLDDIIQYFQYRANPQYIPEDPHIIIAMDENAPIIDRFETFCEMMILSLAKSDANSDLIHIEAAAKRLSCLDDYRIKNVNFILNPSLEALSDQKAFTDCCDLYSSGNYRECLTQCVERLQSMPGEAWWYDLLVRSALRCERTVSDLGFSGGSLLHQVLRCLEQSRTHQTDPDQVLFRLDKLALVSGRTRYSRFIASINLAVPTQLIRDKVSTQEAVWILSSPSSNPMHLRHLAARSPRGAVLVSEALRGNQTYELMNAAIKGNEIPELPEMPAERIAQFRGHAALNRGEPSVALQHYWDYHALLPEIERLQAIPLIYAAQRAGNFLNAAVQTVSMAVVDHPSAAHILPLSEIAAWTSSNLGVNESALDCSIVLHAYARYCGATYDGDLSDSMENTLDFFEVNRPSELIGKYDGYIPALIYFIRNVSTVSRLEDGIAYDTLDDVENERIKLLQWLLNVDPSNSGVYMTEIKEITKDKEVAVISAHLERSKIFVNEEVVRRSFEAEIRYSFARYREMLVEPALETKAESIELRIKKLLREAEAELRDLKLPSTERDSLFRSMCHIMLSAFLIYPNGGLKTYLSTRILHGAFEGELRSTFARAQILFPKEREIAEKEFSRAWSERLEGLDVQRFASARDIVLRFAQKFSDALLSMLNERVRIRLTTTPGGILAYDLSEEILHQLRERISGVDRYQDFVDVIFDEFWRQTEAGLTRIKDEITNSFAFEVFTYLDTAAKSIAELGDGGSELLNTIVQARTEFSNSIQRVSAWFARSGALPEHPFTLDVAIEAAVRVTNNCFPGREIRPSVSGETTLSMPGKWLNAIVDLLCNCFQNAVEHYGSSDIPDVDLSVTRDEDKIFFLISISFDRSVDPDCLRLRIKERLKLTLDDGYRSATEEKGSGLGKIARIVRHDLGAEGTFDVSVVGDKVIYLVHLNKEAGE